ncbi:response regulator transcription factor [Paenibacillus sp. GXUN7292]|uniref:response regulator transcription factor n=1 Tax=Paenibacillus sp. GXUN7292 TaxID=3422499 RepID=UPI003D7EBF0E
MARLLLVDDEPVILEELALYLNDIDGIEEVYTADSGVEAVKLLERSRIDLIVTDIRMPGMSGLELCEYVHGRKERIPCVLLSGYAEFGYAQQALQHKASAYLLKPVKKEELVETIKLEVEKAKARNEEEGTNKKLQQTLRSNLSLLQANLLLEFLNGKQGDPKRLEEQLDRLEIPFQIGGTAVLMLLRIENRLLDYDEESTSLFEFAIMNIAEEVFHSYFNVWLCKDSYHYLVMLLSFKGEARSAQVEMKKLLGELAGELQGHVAAFLKGSISVVVSGEAAFPDQAGELYYHALQAIKQLPDQEQAHLLKLWDMPSYRQSILRSLQRLYEPPVLLQMLEERRWQDARDRLAYIFEELGIEGLDTYEHRAEVYYALSNAYYCIMHSCGHQLASVLGQQRLLEANSALLRSAKQLKNWSFNVLAKIEQEISQETGGMLSPFLLQVHQFIERNLTTVSLQELSDHLKLHPAYISAMYKQETGENLSDYIFRYRMEKARYLLRSSNSKIYEIAEQLGYQSTPYFTKLFKKHFQLTPQEYRDALQ